MQLCSISLTVADCGCWIWKTLYSTTTVLSSGLAGAPVGSSLTTTMGGSSSRSTSSTSSSDSTCSSSSGSAQMPTGPILEVAAVIPWMLLLERGIRLLVTMTQLPVAGASTASSISTEKQLSANTAFVRQVGNTGRVWVRCCSTLESCLADKVVAAELSAAGYSQVLQQAQEQLKSKNEKFADLMIYSVNGSHGLAQPIGNLVGGLAGLATSAFCNSPTCTNMQGLSEYQLALGNLRACAKCSVAYYCSTERQRQHWKQHRPVCKALAAAAAAAAAAALAPAT